MTEQDWIDLGKRAVACEGWRWLPGMLCLPFKTDDPAWPDGAGGDVRFRVGALSDDGDPLVADLFGHVASSDAPDPLPDLRDPCTLGGLLALVREAWGRDGITTEPVRKEDGEWGWGVIAWRRATDGYVSWSYVSKSATEAEALVAALESAPTKANP